MTIVLPVLAVTFAAFCVWLAVRIVNRRERWAKWTAVALLAGSPLLYPLSFGPACWSFRSQRTAAKYRLLETYYGPLINASCEPNSTLSNALNWWANLFAPPFEFVWDGSCISGYELRQFTVTELLGGGDGRVVGRVGVPESCPNE